MLFDNYVKFANRLSGAPRWRNFEVKVNERYSVTLQEQAADVEFDMQKVNDINYELLHEYSERTNALVADIQHQLCSGINAINFELQEKFTQRVAAEATIKKVA